jgi:hypothetical protein
MVEIIRCGSPDCDWGKEMQDLSEEQLDHCYSESREHCIQMHGLQQWDTDAQVHLDLENWRLTLIRCQLC